MSTLARYLAALAVFIAGACSTAMDWRFSYRLGTSEIDSIIWATFSVALDIAKWLMLPVAALAWRNQKAPCHGSVCDLARRQYLFVRRGDRVLGALARDSRFRAGSTGRSTRDARAHAAKPALEIVGRMR